MFRPKHCWARRLAIVLAIALATLPGYISAAQYEANGPAFPKVPSTSPDDEAPPSEPPPAPPGTRLNDAARDAKSVKAPQRPNRSAMSDPSVRRASGNTFGRDMQANSQPMS